MPMPWAMASWAKASRAILYWRFSLAAVGNAVGDAVVGGAVVGDVVVAAQRLESTDAVAHDFTKFPTRILASEATCGLLGDDFSLEPLGHIPLKGKEQSLNVHRVLGRRNL